jgi:Notch-like protein
VAGFANGVCEFDTDACEREEPPYGFIVEYVSECTVQESNGPDGTGLITPHLAGAEERLAGNCDLDVDECDSSPCQNGATCTESSVEASVSVNAYQCTCVAGFANGVCEYDFIVDSGPECDEQESSASVALTGNCDLDVNECDSSPCQNGATCAESSTDPSVSIDAYQCTCAAGFANGVCEYEFLTEYASECDVQESTASIALSGNCDIDVNECDSNPCQNNAACSDSISNEDVSYHAYRCSCVEGFANGACDYDFITEFTDECSVMESEASRCVDDTSWTDSTGAGCDGYGDDLSQNQVPCGAASGLTGPDGRTAVDACCACQQAQPQLSGNCDIDVDECASGPCQNGAVCSHSEHGVLLHA